jgi:nitrite reductase (NADH) small subunit
MREEHVVGRIGDLPEGTHVVVEAAGRQIGLFNVRGEYYALANACFHQKGPLCRGSVGGILVSREETGWEWEWASEGEIVICPWHSLEFEIKTGRCVAFPSKRVPAYEVRVDGDEIRVVV